MSKNNPLVFASTGANKRPDNLFLKNKMSAIFALSPARTRGAVRRKRWAAAPEALLAGRPLPKKSARN
jgi:hypothetical protein